MSSVTHAKPDVQSSADIEVIVRNFYGDIAEDPNLGRFFADVDWDAHLPKMISFWSSILFHTGEYHGRPFDPHARLQGLEAANFDQWLARFSTSVDRHFEGEAADRMKHKAEQIATVFQVKLGLWGIVDRDVTP